MEDLVDRHYESIFRFLRHLTRSTETAQDLTQQTFLRVQTRIHTYRGDSTLKTWIHRIAYREFTGWRRSRLITAPLDVLGGRHDPGYAAVEDAEWLLSLLHRLNYRLRDALLLYEVQGLTIDEIAQVTGDSVGTVKSRLHHARVQLRELCIRTQETKHESRSAKTH